MEFLARRGNGRPTGIGCMRCGSGREHYQTGPPLLIWAAGQVFRLPRFSSWNDLTSLPSMQQHRSSRHSDAIFQTPVVCEAVQESTFFGRTFDGVVAWGLVFLLSAEDQRCLLPRFAEILVPVGRLLFTSTAEPLVWNDAMTGLESRSLGAEGYRRQLSAVGLWVRSEYEDENQNHYFDASKMPLPMDTGQRH